MSEVVAGEAWRIASRAVTAFVLAILVAFAGWFTLRPVSSYGYDHGTHMYDPGDKLAAHVDSVVDGHSSARGGELSVAPTYDPQADPVRTTARQALRFLAPRAIGALDDASRAAFSAADDIGSFTVKSKHLPGAGGGWNKFDYGVDPYAAVQEALRSPGARFLPNPNLPDTFRVVTDLGRAVGTRGENAVRVIVSADGRVINAFPVKTW